MKILWIEDQSNDTKEEFFPEIILEHQICQKDKFDDAFEAISNDSIEYDFVVMDLDLSNGGIVAPEDPKKIVSKHAKRIISKYTIELEEFILEAGYHLAVELIVYKGFPLERMIFLTGNTTPGRNFINIIDDISERILKEDIKGANHLYNLNKHEFYDDSWKKFIDDKIKIPDWYVIFDYIQVIKKEEELDNKKGDKFQELEKRFKNARIPMPRAIKKGEKEELENWFNLILEPYNKNKRYIEYIYLRRGILSMLHRLKNENLNTDWKDRISNSKKISLTNQGGEIQPRIDKNNFISSLKYFFRDHELSKLDNDEKRNKEEKQFYLTVCDYLTKIFEIYQFHNLDKLKGENDWYEAKSKLFPAYFLRNWIAHGLFNGSKNNQFSAKDVAFTFLIAVQEIFECKGMTDQNPEDREVFELNFKTWPELKDFKRLFGDLKKDYGKFLEKVEELYTKKYEYPKNETNKLIAISKRGQKQDIKRDENLDYYDAMHWTRQDFIYNYYASYIFSSMDSNIRKGSISDKKIKVKMEFCLLKTSLLEIAFKRLQEIENQKIHNS